MNRTILRMVAGMAWAGLAVVTATPANAKLQTSQSGSYALCSSSQTVDQVDNCNGLFNYHQNLKLVSVSCSAGNCGPADWWPNVEALYGSGRKTTSHITSCNSWNLWGLNSCAC
jgi:hypothetical protein